ncbi:MAG: lamin tail domain-containing protein, partial [Planctomycetota bacterium]|nr:lamin tail domain-containing protein [Planctomycetota bacterium]
EIANATPGAQIYTTLDGSVPTPEDGTLYTEPIRVEGTPERAVVMVRAAAHREGFLPSRVVTSSYLFGEHVLTQPRFPEGFPRTWPGTTADYEMDRRVIEEVGERAMQGLLSVPTMSVVTDLRHLFDVRSGIYANPSRSGLQWERPVSAEWIFPDGSSRGFQVDCGMRIQGGSSTNNWKSKKVSMRLLFKGDYGPAKLEYPIFPDTPVERFDSILLDAHLNLAYTHPDHGQRVRSQFVRDIFVADLQNATGSLAPHGLFAHLYLNGLYWGMYEIHERPDNAFAEEYLGGDKSEYDVLRHSGSTLVDGNSLAWNEMMRAVRANLRENDNYLALGQWVDVRDLSDYMIVNFYVGNTDWPRHNWYTARRRVEGGQWRFFSWDAEHVLKSVSENQTGVSNGNSPAEIYTRLRQNAEFRLLFADRVHRLFFDGGPMFVDPANPQWDDENPERNQPAWRYMRRIAEIDTAVILESARWGDVRRPGQPYTRDREFEAELRSLLRGYFPARSRNVLAQLERVGLYPRLAAPRLSHPGGEVQPGFTLSASLPAGTEGTIHLTLDGTDPRVFGSGEVSPDAMEYSAPLVLEDFAHVKARTLNEGVWSALKEAVFTVVRPREALRLTEIMYNPPEGAQLEFLEIGNVASVTVGLGGLRFADGVSYRFPEDARLGPGERWVIVSDAEAFAAKYPDAPVDGVFEGSLANGGERLEIRDDDEESVLSAFYDDKDFWPLGADGLGWSLVLASEDSTGADPESWRASASRGGSPGRADGDAVATGVWVNEALTRSSDPLEDAIELYNAGPGPADVGGWYLSDSRLTEERLKKYRIPAGTVIAAGGYLVLYEGDFGGDGGDPGGFALDGGGDDVYLSSADAGGDLTGYVVGHDFGAAEAGVTLGRVETSVGFDFTPLKERTFGVDDPATVEEFRGGLGAENSPPLVAEVVLNELHYHPAAGVEFVELHNRSGEEVRLYDEGLGRGWRLTGVRNAEDTDDYEFASTARIAAGGYLLVVRLDPQVFRGLRLVPADVPVLGPYRGRLDNGGERVRLRRPLEEDGRGVYVTVDRVRYDDVEPWPQAPDGGGPSLERVEAADYANEPRNWGPSRSPGGTPGAANSISPAGGGDNEKPRAIFEAEIAGPLEVLFDASPSRDKDGLIASHAWDFGDGERGTGEVVTHRYRSPGVYTVRLEVTDDGGARGAAVLRLDVSEGGRQLPGDANQDGELNISDALRFLQLLFQRDERLPCGAGGLSAGGNRMLLDVNGDGGVNVTDAVGVLHFLFGGGLSPALGTSCIPIEGCEDVCRP